VTGLWVEGDTFPAVGDLDGDGVLEIAAGANVWKADGTRVFGSDVVDAYTYAAFVDVEQDGRPELLVSGYLTGVALYASTGERLARVGSGETYSSACVADLDGDGVPEIVTPTTTELRVYDLHLTERWSVPATDVSGMASCSAFDFDADGAYDVLYADETTLRVLDGRTGDTLFEYADHVSGTMWEYPVVADIDHDGSSEVVLAESFGAAPGLIVLGHSLEQWPPTDGWWQQYLSDGGDLTAAGHVTAHAPASWRGGGFVHARAPGLLQEDGGWLLDRPQPDLSVTITGVCAAACPDGPFELGLSVANEGTARADALVHLYAVEPDGEREVGVVSLSVASGARAEPVTFALGAADRGTYGWRATVTATAGGVDCNGTNDVDAWIDVPCK